MRTARWRRARRRRRAAGHRLAHRPHGLLALIAARPVEDEDAVEVVDLVLDHARLEPGRLDRQRRAVLVAGAHAHVHGPLDLDPDAGQRQAALLERLQLVAATIRSAG